MVEIHNYRCAACGYNIMYADTFAEHMRDAHGVKLDKPTRNNNQERFDSLRRAFATAIVQGLEASQHQRSVWDADDAHDVALGAHRLALVCTKIWDELDAKEGET